MLGIQVDLKRPQEFVDEIIKHPGKFLKFLQNESAGLSDSLFDLLKPVPLKTSNRQCEK